MKTQIAKASQSKFTDVRGVKTRNFYKGRLNNVSVLCRKYCKRNTSPRVAKEFNKWWRVEKLSLKLYKKFRGWS